MDSARYIKSFSKGQITIPKNIRETLFLGDDFWLKVFVEKNRIIAEPVSKKVESGSYLSSLSSIKGSWFSMDEYKKNRKEIEKRLAKGK